MDLDAVLLARIQFAFTVSFHIIFRASRLASQPSLRPCSYAGASRARTASSVSPASGRRSSPSFRHGRRLRNCAVYQFGTNWSGFSKATGNVLGPLIGYEVLTAFFLEASFLGIMLFGWNRVSPNLHVLSAVLVAIGTSLSAFWILAANSWMHTPAGHEVRDGIAYPSTGWPSSSTRAFPTASRTCSPPPT